MWRCSNYIFILDLTPGFNGLDKHNCKTRREIFKFGGVVWLVLEVLEFVCLWCWEIFTSCCPYPIVKNLDLSLYYLLLYFYGFFAIKFSILLKILDLIEYHSKEIAWKFRCLHLRKYPWIKSTGLPTYWLKYWHVLLFTGLTAILFMIYRYHCNDVIMSSMASHITSPTIVYPTVYAGAEQRKHQSSASLAFMRGIHQWPVNSPHKGPITRKMIPFHDVIMLSMPIVMALCYIFVFYFIFSGTHCPRPPMSLALEFWELSVVKMLPSILK